MACTNLQEFPKKGSLAKKCIPLKFGGVGVFVGVGLGPSVFVCGDVGLGRRVNLDLHG